MARAWLAAGVVLGVPLVLGAALLVWAALPGPGNGRRVLVEWPSGVGAFESGRLLGERGLVRAPWVMAVYWTLFGRWSRAEPGPHVLDDSLSPRQLVERLARLRSRPAVKVTIPEGWHHLQIAARLEQAGVCSADSFRRASTDSGFVRSLGIPADTAEGYLFPATYQLRVDTAAEPVVKTLVREATGRLRKLGGLHPEGAARLRQVFGWSTHELVILASVVEKEAASAEEQRTIASVFFNRLLDRDFRPARRLQSDPTAGYGCLILPDVAASCRGGSQRITPAMLRDVSNPYNTYAHPGLPPGPIGNPGESALTAVLNPAKTDFLFFVAQQSGGHRFSRTLEQHNRAIMAPQP